MSLAKACRHARRLRRGQEATTYRFEPHGFFLLLMLASTAALSTQRRKAAGRKVLENSKQQQADDAESARTFDVIGKAAIGRDEIGQLLLTVTDHTQLDDGGLAMVMSAARRHAGQSMDAQLRGDPLSREVVLTAVAQYRRYLRNRQKVDRLFSRWDGDRKNGLSADELEELINDQEENLKDKREALGMIIEIRPASTDIEFIMQWHADGEGLIDRSQLLPALDTWSVLAEQKVAAQKKCVIL